MPSSQKSSRPRLGVVSLFNTPAGLFRWWEDFPIRITQLLQEEGIEHVTGYKLYLPNTIISPEQHFSAHDETEVPSAEWTRRALAPIVSRYDRVIVHTHAYGFPGTALWRLTVGRSNRAWWTTHHTTPAYRGGMRTVVRHALQYARVIVPDRHYGCSETSAAALRGMFLPKSVGLLLNGRLSDNDLTQFPARSAIRSALFVGRLIAAKGVWQLLEAGAALAATVPDFELVVVGDGPEEEAMRRWISQRELGDRIRMVGYQADVRPFYDRADFMIIPTQPLMVKEGLPLVALEAKVVAIPVLYSLSGGLPETQIEGETGLLLDPPSAEGIVAAVQDLMHDPARYHAMREAIRRERGRWHIDRMAEAYVREYVRALQPPKM